MLTLAHQGLPLAPHDLWGAWSLDPLVVLGLALAGLAYLRGRTPGHREGDVRRARCFAAALGAIAVALVSPLDAMAGALASAHMVQHVLLLLVAAPLLALAAPSSAILRGCPLAVRRAAGRWRRRLGLTHDRLRGLGHPVTVWLLHTATIWLWHAAVLYDAALDNELVHAIEHATFLVTAVLFWRVVLGARTAGRVPAGLGALLVFAMGMQSVFLSVLLTFARAPWYEGYADTTAPWGLAPLADQQLAGVIMWIPAGGVSLAASPALFATWVRANEPEQLRL